MRSGGTEKTVQQSLYRFLVNREGKRTLKNKYYLYLTEFFSGVSVMAVDLTATVRTIARINRSLGQIDELAGRIKALSNDLGENLADRVLDAAEKGADWKESLADRREDLMEDLASWKEELAEQRSEYQLDLALRRAQRLEELEQLRKSLSELLDRHTFGQRRLLRAFPQMRSIDHKQALERLRQRQKERQEKKGGSV